MATTRSGIVVWKRTLTLEEALEPVAVEVVYWPPADADAKGEHWRVEVTGELDGLTGDDAANLALLLRAAAAEVAATAVPAETAREEEWMRRMRGQAPPDVR